MTLREEHVASSLNAIYIFKTYRARISEFAYFRTIMTGLVNSIYSNNNETNNNNKKQLTASSFKIKGDRNRKLKGKGKIRNITGAYGVKRNEEIKKGLDNRKN